MKLFLRVSDYNHATQLEKGELIFELIRPLDVNE